MSRDRLADAYEEQAAVFARLADATAQIAHELRGIEPAVARTAVPDRVPTDPAGSAAGVGSPTPAAQSLQERHVETVLAQCPDHQVAWTVKEAGVGPRGPYLAFWRCNQRVGDGWCKKKPVKAWSDAHPISEGVAA